VNKSGTTDNHYKGWAIKVSLIIIAITLYTGTANQLA